MSNQNLRRAISCRYMQRRAVLTALVVILSSSCQQQAMPAKLTISQADELIKMGAPIGSSLSSVRSFLDSLKIDSLPVVQGGYYRELPYGIGKPENPLPEMRGYLTAAILNVKQEPKTFSKLNIRINFFFDEAERLMDYKIWEQGDK